MEMSRAEAMRSLDNDPDYKLQFLLDHNSLFFLLRRRKESDLAMDYLKMKELRRSTFRSRRFAENEVKSLFSPPLQEPAEDYSQYVSRANQIVLDNLWGEYLKHIGYFKPIEKLFVEAIYEQEAD